MEQTIPELQAQIDQLSLALREWRDSQDHALPTEQRLAQLTERCAEILNRWVEMDERHASAVRAVEARLAEWGSIESRLEHDTAQRLRGLESTIEHEWHALKQLHTEPVKQLREQTATLGETCVAAANLALRGFERAEARLTALETGLQDRLAQLSHDVQTAIAELRRDGGKAAGLTAGVAPFPLEGVMRIHDELRDPAGAPGDPVPVARAAEADAPAPPDVHAVAVRPQPDVAESLANRMAVLEREVTTGRQDVHDSEERSAVARRDSRLGIGIGALALVAAVVLGVVLQQQVNVRMADAAARVTAAERDAQLATDAANRQIAAARAESDRQIAEARQAALTAQVVGTVLAAPDLVRFNLSAADPSRGYAQVLWSRSRGLVLSASRLPPTPDGSTYQVWLLSDGPPVSAGTAAADAQGRMTLAVDTLPVISRAITGVSVTVEPPGGSLTPSSTALLTRAQQ